VGRSLTVAAAIGVSVSFGCVSALLCNYAEVAESEVGRRPAGKCVRGRVALRQVQTTAQSKAQVTAPPSSHVGEPSPTPPRRWPC